MRGWGVGSGEQACILLEHSNDHQRNCLKLKIYLLKEWRINESLPTFMNPSLTSNSTIPCEYECLMESQKEYESIVFAWHYHLLWHKCPCLPKLISETEAFTLLENQALWAQALKDHQGCVWTLFFYSLAKNKAVSGKFLSWNAHIAITSQPDLFLCLGTESQMRE